MEEARMEPERFSISTLPLQRIGKTIDTSKFRDLEPPVIMGILNLTPDSFSDGGTYNDLENGAQRALEMVDEGAGIRDIGGESTRPFADPVPRSEEIRRTIPIIERLVDEIKVPISIDTRHPEVAIKALQAGASIVNDVNGLREPGMEELIAESGASAVIMHMKGTPKDMQVAPSYEDVISDIHNFLKERVDRLVSLGASRKRLIIDPGIGFGKRVGDNLMILRELKRFKDIGCPILIGASRKSFMGHVLGVEVDERLEGSLASAVIASMNGASILRVHDVKETKSALDIFKAVRAPEGFL
jgi:dihydropteroate synthase